MITGETSTQVGQEETVRKNPYIGMYKILCIIFGYNKGDIIRHLLWGSREVKLEKIEETK